MRHRTTPALSHPAPLFFLSTLCLIGALALPPGAAAQGKLVVPTHDASGAVQRIYTLDLDTGRTYEIDPRRSGELFSNERLEQNLFTAIGRRTDTPALPGEFLLETVRDRNGRTRAVLLVETLTGYMAYLTEVGKDSRMGTVRSMLGRPGDALAAPGGNFALLMRRVTGSRRANSAFLLNGTSGECLRLENLESFEDTDPRVIPCDAIPPMSLIHEAVPLEDDNGVTMGYLLVSGPEGLIYRATFDAGGGNLVVRSTEMRLADAFPSEGDGEPPTRRFALAPLRNTQDGTAAILVADAYTGRLALIGNVESDEGVRSQSRLVGPDLFGSAGPPRGGWVAVPRQSTSNVTTGVWLIEAEANRALLIENPLDPADLAVQRVDYRN